MFHEVAEFVGRAMIAIVGVVLAKSFAGFAPARHQILATVGIEHRHALLGQADVVPSGRSIRSPDAHPG